jgi:hypothetical protein
MHREFAVVPPDIRLLLVIVSVCVVAGIVGIALVARNNSALWWLLLILPVVLAQFVIALRRLRIVLDDDTLRISAGFHSAKVKAADLDLQQAKIANLETATELRPRWQLFGSTIGRYRTGHFLLGGRRRAFVLLTTRDRVLALPMRNGRIFLLSLERPQALLDALNTSRSSGRA